MKEVPRSLLYIYDRFLFDRNLLHERDNNRLSDMLFFSKLVLNVKIYCAFEVQKLIKNILETRDNALHRKRSYLQKNKISIFKDNVKVFCNSPSCGFLQVIG